RAQLAQAGLPMAVFDPQRVAQILNELLDNAIKFTPRGTSIELRSDRFRQDDRDWIGIEVADDGPGLPAERIAALFTAFQQGDGSATRTAGGLGLGLARARALAERMGGCVAMESEPGKGCRVRVLLPPA
ncbi:MAG TPA: ATP-binding protein, partial [Planctomycetota bacterium]|nr:ATP-binding protein [Planctomycetota bacterium]